VHGSVLTVLLVVQRMHFFEGDTGIGVHIPQRKASCLPKQGSEAVVLSLPVPLSLCPSLPLPAAAALYRYSVCALIL